MYGEETEGEEEEDFEEEERQKAKLRFIQRNILLNRILDAERAVPKQSVVTQKHLDDRKLISEKVEQELVSYLLTNKK